MPRSTTRSVVRLCVSALALTALAVEHPAAASAAPVTCHGVRATIVGTDGRDHLIGTPHRDVIVALDDHDIIDARAGNDLVCAGQGSDLVHGGAGDDVVYGDDGNATEEFTNDRLYGDAGDDRLLGLAGWDRLDGGAGDDVLRGGPDAFGPHDGHLYAGDRLAGGPGDDLLDVGQAGTMVDGPLDSISFAQAKHGVRVDLSAHTASGEGHDVITVADGLEVTGSSHADVILGSVGDDRLLGEAGGDRIDGRGGNDTVAAGSPDGAAPGPGAHDVIKGGAGRDLLVFLGRTDVAKGGSGPDVVGIGAKLDGVRVDGGPGADVLSYVQPLTGPVTDLRLLAGDGVVRHEGEVAHWSGFSEVSVQARVDVTYVGTSADEDLVIEAAHALDASTRGGDDRVEVVGLKVSSRILTGSGDDEVEVRHAPSSYADGGAGADTIHTFVASTCVNFEVSEGC